MNKKGQSFQDLFLMIILIFALAVGGVISTYFYHQIVIAVQANEQINSSTGAIEAFQGGETVNSKWDYLILTVMIGFALSMVILGYFLDTSTVFLPVYILVLIIGVIITAILQYTWPYIAEHNLLLITVQESFPITNHIMTYFAIYFTLIGALSMVATFAKTRGDQ